MLYWMNIVTIATGNCFANKLRELCGFHCDFPAIFIVDDFIVHGRGLGT